MAFKNFGMLIILRFAILSLGIAGFLYAFNNPRYHAVTLLAFIIILCLIYELWIFLTKTNREIARFLSSARYMEFNQSFEFEDAGAGFKDLGKSFTEILERLKNMRMAQEAELSYMRSIINHIPVPLMTVSKDGDLSLLNNAARRFFGTPQPTRIIDLKQFGEAFYEQLINCRAGEKPVVKVSIDGLDTQVSLGLMEVMSNAGTERLFSLQDIGEELESTQLKAWQDLVRVLTHEIMNSITPVASLAHTTADIAGDVIHELPSDHPLKGNIEKIVNAAMTMSRRAGNLMAFVTNFPQLNQAPPTKKKHDPGTGAFYPCGTNHPGRQSKPQCQPDSRGHASGPGIQY
jgi:two-component system nitrogen regulation sensor histidine kinase NtrY